MSGTEFAERQRIEELIPGSETSGKRDNCIGAADHFRLAFAQIRGDDRFGQIGPDEFFGKTPGEDSDCPSAVFEHRVRQQFHGSDVASAENERHLMAGEILSEFCHGVAIDRVDLPFGPQVDGDRTDLVPEHLKFFLIHDHSPFLPHGSGGTRSGIRGVSCSNSDETEPSSGSDRECRKSPRFRRSDTGNPQEGGRLWRHAGAGASR